MLLINDKTWCKVDDVMSYLCLLDREMMSCVGYPPTIAIITWFMISIGNLSSFDGSNVEASNFKEDLKWHSNKDEVYFIFTGAEDWGKNNNYTYGHYALFHNQQQDQDS